MKLLALTAICLNMIFCGDVDIYPETAIVTDIQSNTVTVETYTGNQFTFSGAEDWAVNDVCSMLMYGNNTANVTDDTIIWCKYSGYMED